MLVTRWQSETGSVECVDFMPVIEGAPGPRIVRRVRVTRGRVAIAVRCRPRFDYARAKVDASLSDGGVSWEPAGGPVLRLTSADLVLRAVGGDAWGEVTLDRGGTFDLVLDGDRQPPPDRATLDRWEAATVDYWREWTKRSTYRGRWRELVNRSALVMKLMTSREHHSIVAAATFGLPEAPGGERNWDYRATWMRDAAFTVYAFLRLGHREEAVAFMEWVSDRTAAARKQGGQIQIMYGLDGQTELAEQSLDHLAGYGGAKPVRIGNDAHAQLQLDIYGELMDTGYLVNKYAQAIAHDRWQNVVEAMEYVCGHWNQPDAGIWERRGEPQHWLQSRVLCWVAADRALRLANRRSLPAPTAHWEQIRTDIYNDVWANFWSESDGHLVASKGGHTVDAAMLMLPLVRFCSATDPKWLATLDAIGRTLVDDGLVYRYVEDDGLKGKEGGFLACSFWYAECLARANRLWLARQAFERAMTHGNHLGLFSEEVGRRGEALGNFPQVLTHLALISAAFYLDRQLSDKPPTEWQP